MNLDFDNQESSRIQIQSYSQSPINSTLFAALSSSTSKLSEERELIAKYEQEFSELQSNYNTFLQESANRESTLLDLLESKDQEIGEYLSKLSSMNQTTSNLSDEVKELDDQLQLLKVQESNLPQPTECTECIRNKSSTLDLLVSELRGIDQDWKETGTDKWEESLNNIQQLTAKVEELQLELEAQYRASQALDSEKEKIEERIKNLSEGKGSQKDLDESIAAAKAELAVVTQDYSFLQEAHKNLCEKLETYMFDKDMLANKYAKVNEMLTQESINSERNLEVLEQEKEFSSELQSELDEAHHKNESISEEVIQERIRISKLREQLMKTTDLDTVLQATLKNLGVEGSFKKTEEGYFYKDHQINLSLHNESFVVIKVGAGLVPLSDYLTTGALPTASKHTLTEQNTCPLITPAKSPMKSCVSKSIKQVKTPMKESNSFLLEKKKRIS